MKFSIMSRAEARRASFNLSERTAIVSINDFLDNPNKFCGHPNLIDVCHVFFDDIVEDFEGGVPISDEDAMKIKEFVDEVWDDIDHLIVHCWAGISRSSGCMSAILQAKGIDDSWIWNDGKYSPNTLVAKKVLKAFGIDRENYDELWQELIDKMVDAEEVEF